MRTVHRGYYSRFASKDCLHFQGNGFSEDELRLWLAQSLLALEYIHSQGVIHRDLKPSNLFLNETRDILIGDFGLATYRRGQPHEDHSFVGTAQYMSPEIVSNEPHSFETDIWCDENPAPPSSDTLQRFPNHPTVAAGTNVICKRHGAPAGPWAAACGS